MAYPQSMDEITDRGTSLQEHPQIHDEIESAINNTQVALGLNPQGDATTVAERMADIEESVSDGVADGAVSSAKLHQTKIWDPLHDAWVAYSPDTQNIDMGTGGSISGRWKRVGSVVHFSMSMTLGAGAEFTSSPAMVKLPITPQAAFACAANVIEAGVTHHQLTAMSSGSWLQFIANTPGGGTAGLMGETGGIQVPFTPGLGADDLLIVAGSYECAAPGADTLA